MSARHCRQLRCCPLGRADSRVSHNGGVPEPVCAVAGGSADGDGLWLSASRVFLAAWTPWLPPQPPLPPPSRRQLICENGAGREKAAKKSGPRGWQAGQGGRGRKGRRMAPASATKIVRLTSTVIAPQKRARRDGPEAAPSGLAGSSQICPSSAPRGGRAGSQPSRTTRRPLRCGR